MEEIRQSLGVCPQLNVLFLQMSVLEHLLLYGELKGLRGLGLEQAMVSILRKVNLIEKQHVEAAALSGGQVRDHFPVPSLYLPCTFPVPSLYLHVEAAALSGGQVRDRG